MATTFENIINPERKWVLLTDLISLVFPLLLNLGLEISPDLESTPVLSKRFLFLLFVLFFLLLLFKKMFGLVFVATLKEKGG